MIAAHPILKHNYRSCFPSHNRGSACFEILGFDVLLDKNLKPWLVEVYMYSIIIIIIKFSKFEDIAIAS